MSKCTDNLTLGELRELMALFNGGAVSQSSPSLDGMIGKKAIFRTQSAGVWYGTLSQKSGKEVILKSARRMWYWQAAKSISLSAVANYGINDAKSKIAPAVDSIWLEVIEIIPCTDAAIESIEGAKDAKAE